MALAIRVVLLLLVVFQQKIDAQQVQIHRKRGLIKCRFDKIYQLGDSISDTGNCIRERICGSHSSCARSPYGIDFFFHKPTGRCSNGLLIIDLLALESGLPLLNPYKDQSANFTHGANFAVAGATALSAEVMAEKKISMSSTNSSLSVQLDWMSSHFKNTCSPGKTMEDLRKMVPNIVQTIIRGVKRVIDFGATRIVVPGTFPKGCGPTFLTQFMTNDSTAYDEYHCLKDLNNLTNYYNDHLEQAIDETKKEYRNITLIYSDYYKAYMWLLRNAVTLGFDENSLQKACCGIGGDYDYDNSRRCGAPGVPVCVDPKTYFNWDGIHLTQEAHSWLAKWLMDDMLPKLNCHI